jgi:CDP-diacylglycerol--glycerol-3-phosphate 3-phosphatidyltransferase
MRPRTVTVTEPKEAVAVTQTGLYAVKPRFQDLLDGPANALVRWHVSPDALTLAGLGCALLGGAALVAGLAQPTLLWLVPLFAGSRLAFNALDGMVASRAGRARPWGKVLNEFSDRLADLAFLFPLLLVPGTNPIVVSAALVSVLLVSYLGILSEAAGARREYGGLLGKADRMLCLGVATSFAAAGGDLILVRLLPAFLIAGSLVTLVQRGRRIHAAL